MPPAALGAISRMITAGTLRKDLVVPAPRSVDTLRGRTGFGAPADTQNIPSDSARAVRREYSGNRESQTECLRAEQCGERNGCASCLGRQWRGGSRGGDRPGYSPRIPTSDSRWFGCRLRRLRQRRAGVLEFSQRRPWHICRRDDLGERGVRVRPMER
jgi:hypothetical protein